VLGELIDGVRTDVLPAVADGRITPRVDSTHPFDQLGRAMAHLRSGKAEGKVAVVID
jgi:NADPH:quinone reductase